MGVIWNPDKISYMLDTNIINPLLHFVQPAGRLISSENLRFSASGGPLGGPPEPPSELVLEFAGRFGGTT